MDGLKVVWTQTALIQRNTIFEYWNKRNKSKSYAKKLNLAIRDRPDTLKKQPNIGNSTIVRNVFSISMRHYSIFYSTRENSIFIVSFWDNRQDPDKLLEILQNNE